MGSKYVIAGMPTWHKPVMHITNEERREKYESRLALEWCRENGNPHLKG